MFEQPATFDHSKSAFPLTGSHTVPPRQDIPNDFVRIFAGGTPPNDFLKKIGVAFGMHDMALDASNEAKQTAVSKKQFAQTGASVSG